MPVSPFWVEGEYINDVIFNIALGKKFNLGNTSLLPFVGAGMASVNIPNQEQQDVYTSISDTDWDIAGGIFWDMPLSRKYGYQGNTSWGRRPTKMYTEHGFRIGLQYGGNADLYTYQGHAFSASINYYYYFGQIKQQ